VSRPRERGQATVELVALVPVVLLVTVVVAQLLAAGRCRDLAGHAAAAAAIALLQDADPALAARRALPGWSRSRLRVRVQGRSVTVTLAPPALVPGLAAALRSTAGADAGPAA
jgi:hypothetical protein